MRVALCISGQPRVWKKTYQNWVDNILPEYEKDIFFHMWDYNTLPSNVFTSLDNPPPKVDIKISEEEKQEIIRKKGNKYCLLSKKTKKNLGCYRSRAGAEKREKQVQYFKHLKKEEVSAPMGAAPAAANTSASIVGAAPIIRRKRKNKRKK